MDNLLSPYLNATSESEQRDTLDELLLVHAAPAVRLVLRRRLGFYVVRPERIPTVTKLRIFIRKQCKIMQILHDIKSSPSTTDIASFEHYVARIAANVCIDYLRTKSPARTRLKDSLRDLFRRHKELVAWEHEGEILCGFAVWRDTGKTFFSEQLSSTTIDARMESFKTARFPHEDVKKAPLSQVLGEVFDWIGGPVEIDALVKMMVVLIELRDQPAQSLDDDAKSISEPHFLVSFSSSDSELRAKELLTRLWQALTKLPREQRDAFCFRFEDDSGQDLFTLLLGRNVVTLRELSREFRRPVEEIVLLSARMPMDTRAIAAELNASRDNIYKWRYRAIRRLKEELERK